MTLIVETGQAAPNAQAYVSASDCAAYHAARGNSLFGAMTEVEQEQAIVRAMDFLAVYSAKWKGRRATAAQALDWPRYDVRLRERFDEYVPADSVPDVVVKALCELAVRAGAGELVKDFEREVIEKTIGPITTKYAPGAPAPTAQFTIVDNLLKPLTTSGGGVRLVRG